MPAAKGHTNKPNLNFYYLSGAAAVHPTISSSATPAMQWAAYAGTGKLVDTANKILFLSPPSNAARTPEHTVIPNSGSDVDGSVTGSTPPPELSAIKAIDWSKAADVALVDLGFVEIHWGVVYDTGATEKTLRVAIARMISNEDQFDPYTGLAVTIAVQEKYRKFDYAV